MKKILISVLFIIAANAAFSQINKGQWMVGGNLSFTSSKDKTTVGGESQSGKTTTILSFNPDAGYFFMDKFAGGLRLNLTTATGGYSSLFVGPFLRYYLLPTAQKVNIFADGTFGFGSSKASSTDKSQSATAFQIMAGPAIFLNEHTALQIAPFFRSESSTEDVGGTKYKFSTTNFGAMVGFQIHLGHGTAKK